MFKFLDKFFKKEQQREYEFYSTTRKGRPIRVTFEKHDDKIYYGVADAFDYMAHVIYTPEKGYVESQKFKELW